MIISNIIHPMVFFSPLEQFELFPVIVGFLNTGIRCGFTAWIVTNSDLIVILGLVELMVLLGLVGNGRWALGVGLQQVSWLVLSVVTFCVSLVLSTVGRLGRFHVGVVVTLGVVVILFNVLGLVPFGFCFTSHIVVTQFLGCFVVGGLSLKGLQQLGFRWFNLFVPRNVPSVMLPFVGFIELVSYVSRMLSLSIRLFANMVAGHALLHILTGALVNLITLPLGSAWVVFLFGVPALLILLVAGLEIGIAFLQGYVFVTLYLIYASDSIFSH